MSAPGPTVDTGWLRAAEALHHALFTGLLLAVAARHGQAAAGDLVYRTFADQHDDKFLPGLERLGLTGLPPAVACAQFIYLANLAGGVRVEYVRESDRRAWVRYPPPRWAYEGPAICAIGNEVSEGFMRAFHARCGDSLGNPRLGFVCTGMTTNGDPGLEGYFEEHDAPLPAESKLRFDLGRRGPRFDPDAAPSLPWDAARAPLARRNYAVQYIRLMLPALARVLGEADAESTGRHAARLVGMQGYADAATWCATPPAGAAGFVEWLHAVHVGTGNRVRRVDAAAGVIEVEAVRVATDDGSFRIWRALFEGALAVHDPDLSLVAERDGPWIVASSKPTQFP